jgi:hypothetical protein
MMEIEAGSQKCGQLKQHQDVDRTHITNISRDRAKIYYEQGPKKFDTWG